MRNQEKNLPSDNCHHSISLRELLISLRQPQELSWFKRIEIAISIAKELEIKHLKDSDYGILKSRNIFLNEKHEVSLSPEDQKDTSQRSRRYYEFHPTNDIYRFGILLQELVWIYTAKVVIAQTALPPGCPSEIRPLIQKCLATQAHNPTMISGIKKELEQIRYQLIAHPILFFSPEDNRATIVFSTEAQQQNSQLVLQNGEAEIFFEQEEIDQTEDFDKNLYQSVDKDPRALLTSTERRKAKSISFHAYKTILKDKDQTPYILILSTKKIINVLSSFFKFPKGYFVKAEEKIHYIAIPFDLLGRYLVLPYQDLKNACELILKANSVLNEFIYVPLLKMIAEYHSSIDDDHYFNETECLGTKDIEEETARYVQAIFDVEEKDSSKLYLQIKGFSQDPIALSYARKMIEGSHLEISCLTWVNYFLVELYRRGITDIPALADMHSTLDKFNILASLSTPGMALMYVIELKEGKKHKDEKLLIKMWALDDTSSVFGREVSTSLTWKSKSMAMAWKSNSHVLPVRYIGLYTKMDWGLTKKYAYFVMDYPEESLASVLAAETIPSQLSWVDRLNIAIDITKGTKYFHDRDMVWGEVSPSHIYLKDKRPLISGFAGSRRYGQESDATFEMTQIALTRVGNLGRLAPELLRGASYNRSTDIYSIGFILFELFGLVQGKKWPTSQLNSKLFPGFRFESKMKSCLEKCFSAEIQQRPSISKILQKLLKMFFSFVLQPVLTVSKDRKTVNLIFHSKLQTDRCITERLGGKDQHFDSELIEKIACLIGRDSELYQSIANDSRCFFVTSSQDGEEKVLSVRALERICPENKNEHSMWAPLPEKLIDALSDKAFKFSKDIVKKQENGVHYLIMPYNELALGIEISYQKRQDNCEFPNPNYTIVLESLFDPDIAKLIRGYHSCDDRACFKTEKFDYFKDIKPNLQRILEAENVELALDELKRLSPFSKILIHLHKEIKEKQSKSPWLGWIFYYLTQNMMNGEMIDGFPRSKLFKGMINNLYHTNYDHVNAETKFSLVRNHTKYELCLSKDLYPETLGASPYPEKGQLSLKAINGKIAYTVTTPKGENIKDIQTEIKAPKPFDLHHLEPLKEAILQVSSEAGHTLNKDRYEKVWLKIWSAEAPWRQDLVTLFSQEKNEHVIKIIRLGEVSIQQKPTQDHIHRYYLVMEYIPFQLFELIKNQKAFPLIILLRIALDAALGLQGLHDAGIIHRNFNTKNTYIGHDFRAYITEFGISCRLFQDDFLSPDVTWCENEFCAPEMEDGKPELGSDIYSLGMFLAKLFCWNNNLEKAFVEKIGSPNLLERTILRCLQTNPSDRPLISEVVAILSKAYTELRSDTPILSFNNSRLSITFPDEAYKMDWLASLDQKLLKEQKESFYRNSSFLKKSIPPIPRTPILHDSDNKKIIHLIAYFRCIVENMNTGKETQNFWHPSVILNSLFSDFYLDQRISRKKNNRGEYLSIESNALASETVMPYVNRNHDLLMKTYRFFTLQKFPRHVIQIINEYSSNKEESKEESTENCKLDEETHSSFDFLSSCSIA